MALVRLERLVAERAALSRADARVALRRGWVAVDGAVVRAASARVSDAARLTLRGQPLVAPPTLALLHKPAGVQCTVGDPHRRRNLEDVAAPLLALGLHPVGRLDADTSGLLPFSRDGACTQRLLHPRHGVEKTYRATVEGVPGPALAARLSAGVETALGVHTARLDGRDGPTLTLTVTEGKHRMVRRMLANVGHPVLKLERLRFGALDLGDLAAGAWRPATASEAAWAAGLTR